MDYLAKSFNEVTSNQDTQMAIAGFLCFIGGWIVITRAIQFLFSILWPFIVLIGITLIVTQFSSGWFTEYMPQYSQAAEDFVRKINEEYGGDRIR